MDYETIAVDFDGTLCHSAWPDIGEPRLELIYWLKRLQSEGHKIILWTCREKMFLVDAIVWCADHGLFFDAVNDNLEEHKEKYGSNCRKVFADWYIDDKALYPTTMPYTMERREKWRTTKK